MSTTEVGVSALDAMEAELADLSRRLDRLEPTTETGALMVTLATLVEFQIRVQIALARLDIARAVAEVHDDCWRP